MVFNSLNKKYGYIDKSGKLVIPFGLDDAKSFVGEYAIFKEDGKYGILDKAGKFALNPAFDEIEIMDNGYVLAYDGVFTILLNHDLDPLLKRFGNAMYYDNYYTIYNNVIVEYIAGDYKMLDYAGNVLGNYDQINVLGEYTFKTRSGELLKTEGISTEAPVDSSISLKGDYEYLFLNDKGEVVLDVSEYDSVRSFSEGRAVVERDGKFGFFDQTGKVVIPIIYREADDFKDGSASVYGNIDYGTIDLEGNPVVNQYAEEIDMGDYYIIAAGSYGDEGIANYKTKAILLDPVYEDISYVGNGIFKVKSDYYTSGFYNANTKKLVEPKYDYLDIDAENGKVIYKEDDRKYGMMDLNGNSILEPIYSKCSSEENGLYLVGKSYDYGLVDTSGKVILETEYDEISKFEEFEDVDVYGLLKGDEISYMIYDKKNNKILSKEKVEISRSYRGEAFRVMEEGYVLYVTSDSKTILRDFSGKVLLTENNELVDVKDEYLLFNSEKGISYIVNFDGTRYLEENEFDDIFIPVEKGHVIFLKGSRFGIISLDGTVKTNKLYENVSYINSGVMTYFKDDEYGYVTINGEEIISGKTYDYIEDFSEGMGLVIKAK